MPVLTGIHAMTGKSPAGIHVMPAGMQRQGAWNLILSVMCAVPRAPRQLIQTGMRCGDAYENRETCSNAATQNSPSYVSRVVFERSRHVTSLYLSYLHPCRLFKREPFAITRTAIEFRARWLASVSRSLTQPRAVVRSLSEGTNSATDRTACIFGYTGSLNRSWV